MNYRLLKLSDSAHAWTAGIFLAVLGLTLLVQSPALKGPFVYDDWASIGENALVRGPELSAAFLARAVSGGKERSRPLSYLTFALQHDASPWAMRLVNYFVHAAAGAALFLLFLALWRAAGPGEPPKGLLSAAVLLWALSPVQLQSTAYVVQRMTSLAGALSLWSIVAFLAWRRTEGRRFFALSLFLFLLALAAKESALALPLLLLVTLAALNTPIKKALRALWPFFALALLAGGLLTLSTWLNSAGTLRFPGGLYPGRSFGPWGRVLLDGQALTHYASLLLWPAPSRLSLDHPTPAFGPPSVLGWLFWLAVAAYGLRLLVKSAWRRRLAGWAILWFLLALSPTLGPLNLDLVMEQRLYLASAGPVLLAALGLRSLLGGRAAAPALLIAAAFFSAFTYVRAGAWGAEGVLIEEAVRKNPGDWRPLNELGSELLRRGENRKALPVFEEALRLMPRHPWLATNLARAAARTGEFERALAAYRWVLEKAPENQEARVVTASMLLAEGKLREALDVADGLPPGVKPTDALLLQKAEALRRLGQLEEASRVIDEVRRAFPRSVDALLAAARLAADRGERAGERRLVERALKVAPRSPEAHIELGRLNLEAGQVEAGLAELDEAVKLDPSNPVNRFALAEALQNHGRLAEAIRQYRLLLDKGHPQPWTVLNNLGAALAQTGRLAEAKKYFEEALARKPGFSNAVENLELLRRLVEQGPRSGSPGP